VPPDLAVHVHVCSAGHGWERCLATRGWPDMNAYAYAYAYAKDDLITEMMPRAEV
jgi:hypothetical protein